MNRILSDNKNSIICIFLITFIFSIALAFISANKQTIAPIWYVNDYPPWSKVKSQEFRADYIYGYRHKGHDQVMQFFLNRSDSLRQLDLERSKSFSDKMMLGGQLNSRIQFSYGLHGLISNILNKFNKKNYLETVFISINLSTLVWTILSFFIIFYLCQGIFGRSQYNYLYIFLFNPLFIVNAEEAWQMLILGTYFIIFGSIQIEKSEKIKLYIFSAVLICIGSILIIRANSTHYWLYFPLTFLFFLPYMYDRFRLTKLVIIILSLSIGAAICLPIIIDGLTAVQNSSSNIDMKPWHNLHRMEYSALPISYFIGIPLLSNFYELFNILFPFNGIVPAGEGFFGPTILILSLIGFYSLKNNYLRLAILLLLLYWCGPLQLIFRFVIGGPFISETSVGGRLGVYIYIILLSLSIYAIISNLDKIKFYSKYIYIYCGLVIVIHLVQFFIILNSDILNIHKYWLFGLIGPISSMILIIGLKYKGDISRFILLISLAVVPFYSTLSPYGINSIFPSPIDYKNQNLENRFNFEIDHGDVGALAIEYKNENYTKKPLPSNFWYFTKARSINGFYTPVDKNYLYLYYYQYFSNWPSSTASKYSIQLPGKNFDEKPTLEKLGERIHRHHAMSIPVYKNKFSNASERFFDLTGVNLLVTENKLLLKDKNYSLLQNLEGIKVWQRKKSFDPIRITCSFILNNSKLESVETLLFDNDFHASNSIISNIEYKFEKCRTNSKIVDFDFNHKYGIKISLVDPSGIIATNLVYNVALEARDSNKLLDTFRCNVAFMCIIPATESTEIFLKYKKISIYKKVISLFH